MKFKASSLLAAWLLVPGSIAVIHGAVQASTGITVEQRQTAARADSSIEANGKQQRLLLAQSWNSLTPRQKQLDRNIRAVLQQAGRSSIPVNQQTVAWMMQQIGAQPQEANYVAQRMQLYVQVDSTLNSTDRTLCAIGRQHGLPQGTQFCR